MKNMIKLQGWTDEVIIGLVMVCFAMFSLIVLSTQVGQILLGFGLIYLIAVSLGKDKQQSYAYQIVKTNKDLVETIGVSIAAFFGFTLLSDFLMGHVPQWIFSQGSSVSLYSAAMQPIVTINTPLVQMLIWGFLIPILENCFFVGVIGFLIAYLMGLHKQKFNIASVGTWVAILLVGAIAASFHFISQLLTPELLMMDMVLFGTGMLLALKYNVLKHGIIIHIMLNAIAMGLRLGWF